MRNNPLPENLANYLALHSLDCDNIGLLTGRMGHIIALSRYSTYYSKPVFDSISDFLFAKVTDALSNLESLYFGDGLAGICWAIEYLVQHGYMEGPAHDMCSCIENKIIETNIIKISDFSLETGLLGLWEYVIARVQGNMEADLPLPFPHEYLKDWEILIEKNVDKFPQDALMRLKASLNGTLIDKSLDIEQFIKISDNNKLSDLSLKNGISGKLFLMCL